MEIKIENERLLYLKGKCDITAITELIEKINKIEKSDDENRKVFKLLYNMDYNPNPIELYINTYGGDVYPSLGLVDKIMSSKTPVHTFCTGVAASSGLLILLAGYKRFGHTNSSYLIHSISTLTFGQIQDIEENLEECQRLNTLIQNIILERTSISKEKLDDTKKRKYDWWFDSAEALKMKVIDEIKI